MRILLSIKPNYAESIFNGSKAFEFRKAIFKNPEVKTVVVYATKPVGKVIGEFAIAEVIKDAPRSVWKRTKHRSGISRLFFDEYFEGRSTAFAIRVGNIKKYKVPLSIEDLVPGGTAPQSFRYLPQIN